VGGETDGAGDGLGTGVAVGAGVAVGVGVALGTGVGVGVAVGTGVGVGAGPAKPVALRVALAEAFPHVIRKVALFTPALFGFAETLIPEHEA